jgi:small-conductance mechanosensitive channel
LGTGAVLAAICGFMLLGLGSEWIFARGASTLRRQFGHAETGSIRARFRSSIIDLAFGAALLCGFALGSLGAFLAFDWPPTLRDIVVDYLLAFLAVRAAILVGKVLFAPHRTTGGEAALRIVPLSVEGASFWHVRICLIVLWVAFGASTVGMLDALGVSRPAHQLVAYAFGLGLLAIGIEAVWRRPDEPSSEASPSKMGRHLGKLYSWLLSLYFVVLWALWFTSAMPSFWFLVVVVAVPSAIRVVNRSVAHLGRSPDTADERGDVKTVRVVLLERGIRAIIMIIAAVFLANAWQIDLNVLAAQDSSPIRILRGVLNAVVIILAADLIWQLIKAAIDQRLEAARVSDVSEGAEARRRARVQTLLPVCRNLILVTLVVITILMLLAGMGVNIAPLVAGAGVVGVALGFGAQTLVRDIISGMFYLADDAFRVGEYIQSSNYKGTVESFSLRSVKLRHHRGPLYTVPFGSLGAIQNMSRDWVVTKLTVGVTYDSDLDLAKKLIKKVGQELKADPEFADHILGPLKLQGVYAFGDFAIQLRMKMTTKPDDMQFVIRFRAHALIKKTFDANGIKFAFPTVQVAGEQETSAAVARQALELVHPKEPSVS